MKRSWLAAGAGVALYLLLGWVLGRGAGVMRTVAIDEGRDELAVQRVGAIDLAGLSADALARPGLTVTWRGVWRVPASGLYELALDSRGRSTWRIDGVLAQQSITPDDRGARRAVWLPAGFHAIEISHQPDGAGSHFAATVARPGTLLEPLDSRALRPRAPRNPGLHRAGDLCHRGLFWLSLAMITLAARRTIAAALPSFARRWRSLPQWNRVGRMLAWAALAIVMAYGALLRLDAITVRFGVVSSPSWVAALQTRTLASPGSIRPSSMRWDRAGLFPHADGPPTRYLSDPYTYLQAAREKRSFYSAHYREPVFPAATRVGLALFNNQDVAISFTSTAFSVLAIWLTYLLGAAVWSRPAGVFAALGFALDYDAITLASLGWRDDAYVAAVALGAYLMLHCWRAGRTDPREWRVGPWRVDAAYLAAVALGLVAGLIVLVRIMAVSFLAAGAVWLLLTMRTTWRRRLTMAGLGVVMASLVAGPYFVNCWRVYGDPLYTFNVHGDVYRVAEGGEATRGDTMSYIIGKAAARPFQMADTVAAGLTSYPFSNKWSGLNHWWARAGWWASLAALVGLVVLASTPQGRLLLVVMVTSLVPFAFTWKVDPNWRFTVHVYPFLLIAAAAGASSTWSIVRALLLPRRETSPRAPAPMPRPSWLAGGVAVVVGLVGAWVIGRELPARAFAETLRHGEDGTVAVGPGDAAFLGRGWSEVLGDYPVRLRVATGEATIVIPLPAVADYPITLRLDPFPTPLPNAPPRSAMVDVEVNGAPIGRMTLEWTPGRVGAYRLVIPRASVQRGDNHFVLRVRPAVQSDSGDALVRDPGLADGDAFSFWLLRVHPAQ